MAEQAELLPDPPPAEQLPTDRPVQNVMGEFSRKFGQIERSVGALAQAVDGLIQQRQAPPPPSQPVGNPQARTVDELWEGAKAGNKEDFEEWNRRKAAETYTQMRGIENHQALVEGQLNILQGKYPVLADPNHALTQTAQQAYTLLTRRGYPATQATFLEAVKTAIADRPDIVAESYTQGARAREGARRVSAGNPGVIGATHRQDEPAQPGKMRVTPEQAALARRMNVKDPAKAMQNFLRRRETGESNFGAVGAHLPEGEF